MQAFLIDSHKLYLVKLLPEALSPWLPPHILSWLFLPSLAIPPGPGCCLTLARQWTLCKHSSVVQLSHDLGYRLLILLLRLLTFPTQPVCTVDNQALFAPCSSSFISLLSSLSFKEGTVSGLMDHNLSLLHGMEWMKHILRQNISVTVYTQEPKL